MPKMKLTALLCVLVSLTGCASSPNTEQRLNKPQAQISESTPVDYTIFTRRVEKNLKQWDLKEQELLQVLEP